VADFHVVLTLTFLHFVCLLLDLMRVLIIFLLSEVCLNLALVQEFSRKFECEGQGLLEGLTILLELLCVSDFELLDLLLVLLLGLGEHTVPVLVELLVLLDVRLLDLFLPLLVSEDHLLVVHLELLLLKLSYTILSHFGLYSNQWQRIK
jgi:hypothetical protein